MGVNVLQAMTSEQMKFKAEVTEDNLKYRNYILDLSLPTNEPRFMFSIGGVPTIPQGELIGIKGKAKMGKSQFEYYLVAVMLSGAYLQRAGVFSLQQPMPPGIKPPQHCASPEPFRLDADFTIAFYCQHPAIFLIA